MKRLQRALEDLAERGDHRDVDQVLAAARSGGGCAERRRSSAMRRAVPIGLAAAAVTLVVGFTMLLTNDGRNPIDVATGDDSSEEPSRGAGLGDDRGPPADSGRPAEVPSVWVGHGEDHRLVVVDTASGQVLRVLAEFDDPDTFVEETGEPFAGGSFLGDFALTPDGGTVYWERCCEPAPGTVFRAPVEGGEAEQVVNGAYPAISPDGSRLAVVVLQWIMVVNLETGETTPFAASEPQMPSELVNIAWSPDGRSVVFEQYGDARGEGRVMALDVDDATSLDEARAVVTANDDGTPMFPTFDGQGRLHVVRQQRLGAGVDGPAQALVVDPGTGKEISIRPLATAVADQGHDASGTYLIRTFVDGLVQYRTIGGEPVPLAGGYRAGTW